MSDDYAAAISAIEVDDGDFTVTVSPGATAGAPAIVAVSPSVACIPTVDVATTGSAGGGDTLKVDRDWDKDNVTVSGAMPADQICGASVVEPFLAE